MKRGLTIKQKERFDFIKEYIAKNGYAPTLKEIAEEFKTTNSAVYYILDALVKKEWIKREKYAERDIVII